MTTYLLAVCPTCGRRYAIHPDPVIPGGFLLYRLSSKLSHGTTFGYLCIMGHYLTIYCVAAVMTNDGHWVRADQGERQAHAN